MHSFIDRHRLLIYSMYVKAHSHPIFALFWNQFLHALTVMPSIYAYLRTMWGLVWLRCSKWRLAWRQSTLYVPGKACCTPSPHRITSLIQSVNICWISNISNWKKRCSNCISYFFKIHTPQQRYAAIHLHTFIQLLNVVERTGFLQPLNNSIFFP